MKKSDWFDSRLIHSQDAPFMRIHKKLGHILGHTFHRKVKKNAPGCKHAANTRARGTGI
jgi:hypothetical protein